MQSETDAIRKDIQGMQQAIEKRMDQMSDLSTPLKHAMSDMGESLKGSVAAVASQVNEAVGKVSSDVLRSLEDSRRLLDSKVGNIETALTSMDKSTTEAIERTQAKLTAEIKDVQAAVLDGSQRVLDSMEDKMIMMRLEMQSFESSLSEDLSDVQRHQEVLGDMIVGNAMRLDELQSAVDGSLALAEEHQLESFQVQLSEVLVDMRSALVTAVDLEEQASATKLAYGRAVQHYSQCLVPWEEVLDRQASMNNSQALKEPQQFLHLQTKAAASLVKAAQILSAGRVVRRLIEKAILEILPAGLKQDDFTVCREYFSPMGLQRIGEAIQSSASTALTSVSRQLEYLHSLWIRTRQVSARNGAAIGRETTLLTQDPHSIVYFASHARLLLSVCSIPCCRRPGKTLSRQWQRRPGFSRCQSPTSRMGFCILAETGSVSRGLFRSREECTTMQLYRCIYTMHESMYLCTYLQPRYLCL